MRRHRLLPALLLLAATSMPAAAEVPEAKKQAIQQLVVMTGADQIGQMFGLTFIDMISQSLRAARPDIPERAYTIIREEVRAVMQDEFTVKQSFYELVYPIYDRHFSLEELHGMIDFYSTPLGRKTISVLPQLTQESMAAGQAWGQSLAPVIEARIVERLRAEKLLPTP